MEFDPIQPISPEDFNRKVALKGTHTDAEYLAYFKPYIDKAGRFAVGPYYWFIPDNSTMHIIAASANIGQLTPYTDHTEEDWKKVSVDDFANIIHPDDCNYVLSAIQIVLSTIESTPREKIEQIKFNIYGRFMNADGQYRWVLIQFPAFYVTDRVESVMVFITDLSHLNIISAPLLTVSDYTKKNTSYFNVMVDSRKKVAVDLPIITKRERDIVQLMAKGLKTPEIAKELFISYSTVENHRKNLRTKTNTKTSAELINFVIRNNLIGL